MKKKKKMKSSKNYAKGSSQKELPKSEGTVKAEVKPVNREIFNRADDSLNKMMNNKGFPRQKVKLK